MDGTYTMQGDYRLPDLRFTPSVYGDSDVSDIYNGTIKFSTTT